MNETVQMFVGGDRRGAPTAEWVAEVCDTLVAEAPALVGRTTAQIAAGIAATVQAWLEPDSTWLRRAVEATADASGLTEPMIEWSLVELLRRTNERSLIDLVRSELGSPEPFQEPRSRPDSPCKVAVTPPSLVFQVLAGTVPPVGIEAIVLALLARSPVLIKTSSAEPDVPRVFLESLRACAPDLARHVAVMTWDGADRPDLSEPACAAASVVTAYGNDAAVNALMSQCRFPTRFQGYGHRVSFAIVGPAEPLERVSLADVAEALALDASAFDQRGCMSPHCVFVSREAPWSVEQLAEALASHGFPAIEARLPRGKLTPQVGAGVAQARGVAQFGARAYEAPTGLAITHDTTAFVPSPGGRTLHVVPYEDEDSLIRALRPLGGAISTVGIRYPVTERTALATTLGRMGARRICRLGRMQRPIWVRAHDGRPRIADWVDWINVEPLY